MKWPIPAPGPEFLDDPWVRRILRESLIAAAEAWHAAATKGECTQCAVNWGRCAEHAAHHYRRDAAIDALYGIDQDEGMRLARRLAKTFRPTDRLPDEAGLL